MVFKYWVSKIWTGLLKVVFKIIRQELGELLHTNTSCQIGTNDNIVLEENWILLFLYSITTKLNVLFHLHDWWIIKTSLYSPFSIAAKYVSVFLLPGKMDGKLQALLEGTVRFGVIVNKKLGLWCQDKRFFKWEEWISYSNRYVQ